MAAVLDAVDLVAIAAILVLYGLLLVTKYTFQKFANIMDVSILGTHPFGFISSAINGVIMGGINDGLSALGTALHDLWAGLKWSIELPLDALEHLVHYIRDALSFLWDNSIPALIKIVLSPINKAINAVASDLSNLKKYAYAQVARLDQKIIDQVNAVKNAVEKDIGVAQSTVERELTSGLNAVYHQVTQDIGAAMNEAEKIAADALSKVSTAETAAITAVGHLEDLTARELHDFIKSVPLTDLEALLTAVPILAAVVDVALSESGMNGHECRTKVKGICGTDPTQWFRLLEGLTLIGAGISLTDIFDLAVSTAKEAMPIVKSVVT